MSRANTTLCSTLMALSLLASGELGFPTGASAQIVKPGTWTVTPSLGVAFGGDIDGSSLALGVALGYDWTPRLGFEGEFGYLPDLLGDDAARELSVATFSLNGVYYFDVQRYVPYVTLGLGFDRVKIEQRGGSASETELAVNFGAGLKARIGRRALARGDLRYFSVNDANPDFWRLSAGVTFVLGR